MSRREKPTPLTEVIRDPDAAIAALRNDLEIGIDLETSGLSPWQDRIAVVTMYGEQSGQTALLHIRGKMPDNLRRFLSVHPVTWTGHNVAGFDMLFLANAGVDIQGSIYYDTMIGEQMTLSSGRRDVRVKYQDAVARRLEVYLLKDQGESSWMQETLNQKQEEYCVSDVFYLPALRKAQMEKVAGTRQHEAMVFEQNLIPIVAQMSLNGLPLDRDALAEWLKGEVVKSVEARRTIAETFGPSFNPGSPKQIRDAYLKVFDIELESTDKEHLIALAEIEGTPGQLADAIARARRASKRTGMYDDQWVADYCYNGRVNARFWQVGTDTFRFSSTTPNLQQIPRDGRGIFGGKSGYMMVKCDFSQLEVRVAAATAGDETMLAGLGAADLHSTIAGYLYGIDICERCHKDFCHITKEQRRIAKAAVFTLLFGGSASGLVRYAKMSGGKLDIVEAQRVVHTFFNTYRGLAEARAKAKMRGAMGQPVAITLPNGARRVLPAIDGQVRPSQILNTMVQGSAAIGMKYALFECRKDGLMPYIGAVVHDEIVACVPEAMAQEFAEALDTAMKRGMSKILGTVPVGTEYAIGTHWS